MSAEKIIQLCEEGSVRPNPGQVADEIKELMLRHFPAALLGRLVTIAYYPLSDEVLADIVRLQFHRIKQRVEEQHGIPFEYSDEVVALVVGRCTSVESGGRLIDSILTNTVLPEISRTYLTRLSQGRPLAGVALSVEQGDFHYKFE